MHTPKGLRIPKSSLPPNLIEQYRNDLTVTPNTLSDYGPAEDPFPVYRESSEYIYLPKFYNHRKDAPNSERIGCDISLKFSGTLREFQKHPATTILNHINTNDSAILCVGCGFGKTFLALWIATQIGKKTLIVVHKEFLLQQWIQRIREFLPDARIGILQQNTIDIDDKDIVVSMLQSLTVRKNEYPHELFDSFGFSIFDECHHICSRTFSKAIWKVATKKSLGLSATPHRKDGLTKVLGWFLGPIVSFTTKNTGITKPLVRFINAEYHKEPTIKYNFHGKVILPTLLTELAADPTRNMQIVTEIRKCLTENRKILVLSERRLQCETIKNILGGDDVGLYLGGMSEVELQSSNEKKVILATYNMAAEGYDCSTLDTLIMASGRSDIEQSVGRILRKPNSNVPLIIDFVDSVEGLSNQAVRRRRYYKKHGFKFESEIPSETAVEFLDD